MRFAYARGHRVGKSWRGGGGLGVYGWNVIAGVWSSSRKGERGHYPVLMGRPKKQSAFLTTCGAEYDQIFGTSCEHPTRSGRRVAGGGGGGWSRRAGGCWNEGVAKTKALNLTRQNLCHFWMPSPQLLRQISVSSSVERWYTQRKLSYLHYCI